MANDASSSTTPIRANDARRRFTAFSLGLLLAAAAALAALTGTLDRFDRFGLDLHFRILPGLPADPSVILVDIDDPSLAAAGNWPWPRRLYADLVSTLIELGCGVVALDVVLDEPAAPRVEHADLDPDLHPADVILGNPASDRPIFDDDELRDALSSGPVVLPMFARTVPPDEASRGLQPARTHEPDESSPSQPSAADPPFHPDALHADRDAASDLSTDPTPLLARLIPLLERDFSLDENELIDRLQSPSPDLARIAREQFATAKRLVARRAVRRIPDLNLDAAWSDLLAALLPDHPPDALGPDRQILLDAFRAEKSRRAFLRTPIARPIDPSLARRVARAADPVFPLHKFIEAGALVGFVGVGARDPDGVVRSVPLMLNLDGRELPHLALVTVLHRLRNHQPCLGEGDAMRITTRDGIRRVPFDDRGRTLVNWHVPPLRGGVRDWRDSFVHLPAARPLELARNRRAIADNARRLALARAELVELRHAETPPEYADYADLIRRRDRLDEQLADAATARVGEPLTRERKDVDAKIRDIERDALDWLERAASLWRDQQPENETETLERRKILRLHDWFHDDRLAKRIAESDRRLERRSNRLRDELRPMLGQKVCLVGYTASGVADLVTTPVHVQAPGVIVHANVVNMLLQNRFISRAKPYGNALLVLLAGCLAASAARAAGGWCFSLAALLAALALTFSVGVGFFHFLGVHVASVPAIVASTAVWSGVTLHRRAIEERARRRLHRALVQYTSPAIAARIAEHADRNALAPQSAVVSCFFADLRGFTRISAKLGPARTRNLINPYLQGVSRALIENGAMVNKFVGDGIFAFFNSPLLPCADHAAAACRAALKSLAVLRELSRSSEVNPSGAPLAMRIGVSTGEAFVGDYGSDLKLDYTCLGDIVNLGSRLEQANKMLGTTILVDQATLDSAGTQFAFRPVGRLKLAGREEPTEAFELVGFVQSSAPDFADFQTEWSAALRAYQAGDWDECRRHLERCAMLRPDDALVGFYRRSIETLARKPLPHDWRGEVSPARGDVG